MDRYQSLKRNTIIITIANLGSKMIAFILAPLYSFFLTPSEYGTMDLLVTTVSLIMPVVCLNIYESTFRFSGDKDESPQSVLNISILIGLIGSILSIIIFNVCAIAFKRIELFFVGWFITVDSINNILSQYARGQGRVKIFAFGGVVNSLVTLLMNVLFMVSLSLGLQGWMLSYLLGKIAQLVYLVWSNKIWRSISIKSINPGTGKRLLKFCMPLIPTTIMWWVMNVSDRYAIALFLGAASNGIYAVASKIPSLLSLFENIFYQAWQISAVSMVNDADKDEVYSDLFEKYFRILVLGYLLLLVFIKPLIGILFEKSYFSAWISVAPLLAAVVFHALAGFLGAFYTAFKKTEWALITTVLGATVNIVLNFLLIPRFGIVAAAVTTLLGYGITAVARWINTQMYVKTRIERKIIIGYSMLMITQLVLYYLPGVWSIMVRICIAFVVLYDNKNMIKSIIISKIR